MKSRPILFSGPMVRAILEGRKTMTRRTVKPQPAFEFHGVPFLRAHEMGEKEQSIACPYGVPGDRLWVRETWRAHLCDGRENESIHFRADGESCPVDGSAIKPWRPSIFMPRWASRITLEVAEVRVERLQDISEEDALAEGLTECVQEYGTYYGINFPDVWETDPRKAFKRLWESINGKGSWNANPWVWVVSFRRVQP